MASKPMVPVEDYLRMKFEGPDAEYLDGELLERHFGGTPHSRVQDNLLAIFRELRKRTSLRAFPELHLRTGAQRYRIADIAVFIEEPQENIPSDPPCITIEIISPDDSMNEIRQKCQDYQAWGVQHIWLANPAFRAFSVWENGLRDVPRLELPEFDLVITPEQVFE